MSTSATPEVPHRHIRNPQRIPNTNDLWVAETTDAHKITRTSKWRTVTLCHNVNYTQNLHGRYVRDGLAPHYRICGELTIIHQGRHCNMHKVWIGSPSPVLVHDMWVERHNAVVYTDDGASAYRILIALTKELALDAI